METHPRMPLHDLALDQFLASGTNGNKTPRNHKRPLSPSRNTPLNPAKRRVLDAEVVSSSPSHPVPFMLSNIHTMTPSRPSRLGHGVTRNYRATSSSSSLHRCSPSRDLPIESSTNPQSRHYPGFDIFRDGDQSRVSPVPGSTLPLDGDDATDRSDEDKENMPLRRKTKKQYTKKRLLPALDGSDLSSQMNKVARPERTPFAARQALR